MNTFNMVSMKGSINFSKNTIKQFVGMGFAKTQSKKNKD